MLLGCRRNDLDNYAVFTARDPDLGPASWEQLGDLLRDARRPLLVYGPGAMTPDFAPSRVAASQKSGIARSRTEGREA